MMLIFLIYVIVIAVLLENRQILINHVRCFGSLVMEISPEDIPLSISDVEKSNVNRCYCFDIFFANVIHSIIEKKRLTLPSST